MAITRDLWIVLRARDEASRIIRSFGNNVAAASATAGASMSTFERRMAAVAQTLNQFAMTSMLAGTVMAGLGAAGIGFVKSLTDVAAEYDRQVRYTMTQIDGISTSLEEVGEIGRRVASEVEIPFEQMQDTLFLIFSSMNVSLKDAEKLLKGFSQEAVAGQTSVENAARSNISIMNALGLTTNDLTRIQDVQFQVVRKGVITYEELANVIGRALPAAARSGQDIETLGAMIAFLTRNGLSAAMAATSAARAMESFAHPKTVARLEDMGIKVKNARGEFLPLLQVMEQMNKKLSVMTQPERAKALQELFLGAGGTIQARRFWDTAFKNFGDFEEMMGFMRNSAGVFEDAYSTMSDSVAAKTTLLHNKWMILQESLGKALLPHLIKLIGLVGVVLDWFNKLPGPIKDVIAQVLLWGSIIMIAVGALTIFIGVLAFFVSSIMMAGAALVYILAAMTALILGTIGLGAAIYAAWQRSESFRKLLMDMRDRLAELWSSAKDLGEGIKQSFEQNIVPAMQKLWNIIDTKVMPALQRMVQLWREEVLPKIEEGARLVKDVFGTTFEFVAKIINDVVIPAIKKLTDWWEKNSDTVRPFLNVLGEVFKWLMVIAAVIIALPFALLAAAIAVVIGIVWGLIIVVKTLWEWITTAFNAVKEFFTNIANAIFEFVKGVYDKVFEVLRPITDLFKEVFGLIGDIIKFFTVLATEIFKDWILPLLRFLRDVWNGFVDFLGDLWDGIVELFKAFFRIISDLFGPFFKPLIDGVKDFFKDVGDTIGDAIEAVKDFFKGAGDWLFDAGKKIITGLLDGITSKIKELREKFKEITELIPKIKGPRAVDLRLLMPAGKGIMQGLIKGIDSQIPMLQAQLQGITAQVGQIPTPSLTVPAPSFASNNNQSPQITQNITINTQEINPRMNAEELGFELGNRL